jgi:plastocyanin
MLIAAAGLTLVAAEVASAETKAMVVIKDHKFEPAEIHVPAGQRITLTLENQDPTPEEFESRDLKLEKIVPGASSGIVRFGPLQPGTYPFVGEFHEDSAQGKVIVE